MTDQIKKPIPVSYEALKKLVKKAYKLTTDVPAYYPTVEEIDDLLVSREFQEVQVREDAFKFFVMHIIYGFTRDKVWHKNNPGKRYITADNMIHYLLSPVKNDASMHINVWNPDDDDELKENRQAAFEYMQSIIMDESMFHIETASSAKKTEKVLQQDTKEETPKKKRGRPPKIKTEELVPTETTKKRINNKKQAELERIIENEGKRRGRPRKNPEVVQVAKSPAPNQKLPKQDAAPKQKEKKDTNKTPKKETKKKSASTKEKEKSTKKKRSTK